MPCELGVVFVNSILISQRAKAEPVDMFGEDATDSGSLAMVSSSLPATPVEATRRDSGAEDTSDTASRPSTVPVRREAQERKHERAAEGDPYRSSERGASAEHSSPLLQSVAPVLSQGRLDDQEQEGEEGSGRESDEDIGWTPQMPVPSAAPGAVTAVPIGEEEPPPRQSASRKSESAGRRAPRSAGKELSGSATSSMPQYPYDSFDMLFSNAYGPDGACKCVIIINIIIIINDVYFNICSTLTCILCCV